MTYISSATVMIDVFGRETAPSLNPEMEMALQARSESRKGSFLAWLRRTAIVRALVARKKARDMERAFDRLTATSAHLLADIGMLDVADPVAADTGSLSPRDILQAARVPVSPRPALRPAILVKWPAQPRAAARPQARPAPGNQPAAQ